MNLLNPGQIIKIKQTRLVLIYKFNKKVVQVSFIWAPLAGPSGRAS
jgi:hypothetical protein